VSAASADGDGKRAIAEYAKRSGDAGRADGGDAFEECLDVVLIGGGRPGDEGERCGQGKNRDSRCRSKSHESLLLNVGVSHEAGALQRQSVSVKHSVISCIRLGAS
jgi:hypothetical protein